MTQLKYWNLKHSIFFILNIYSNFRKLKVDFVFVFVPFAAVCRRWHFAFTRKEMNYILMDGMHWQLQITFWNQMDQKGKSKA